MYFSKLLMSSLKYGLAVGAGVLIGTKLYEESVYFAMVSRPLRFPRNNIMTAAIDALSSAGYNRSYTYPVCDEPHYHSGMGFYEECLEQESSRRFNHAD